MSRLRSRARLAKAWLAGRPGAWLALLGAFLIASVLYAAAAGALERDVPGVLSALVDETDPLHAVLWEVRLPRIVVAVLVGASLAVAGVLMQTVVRNPLADPSLIGISAGAGVAGLIAIVLLPEATYLLTPLAFGGAAAAALVVLALSWSANPNAGPLRIVLSGVAIQAILFAGIALITFLFADRAPSFAAFAVGSLAGSGWRDVEVVGPSAILGTALALLAVRPLNVLLLDESTAAAVGLRVRGTRLAASSLAALLAAGAVSVAGLVGFVGLVVPNAVRILVGPEHGRLLVLSALGGASLVVLADTAARTVVAPLELPVGSLLALLGGPYFLAILWRRLP